MSATVRWRAGQQQCLAAMGLRQWRPRQAPSAERTPAAAADESVGSAAVAAPADARMMAWLSAASHEQPARLALVWSEPVASPVEPLLRDLARHLGAALPGQPQFVDTAPAASCTLAFGDQVAAPPGAIRLPALSELASGEVALRRQAWQTLRRVIMEQTAP